MPRICHTHPNLLTSYLFLNFWNDQAGSQGPQPRVDVLAIGAALLGDAEFVAATAKMINQRSIVYLGMGTGNRGEELRIGDPMPQYTCGPFLGCEGIGTGPDGTQYHYARQPAIIAFTSRDLGNAERWGKAETIFLSGDAGSASSMMPSMRNIAACHICSYMCWFSKGVGGDYSLCHFKEEEDETGLPDTKLCYFPDIPF